MKALMVSVIFIRAIQVAFVISYSPSSLPYCYRIALYRSNSSNNKQLHIEYRYFLDND